MNDSLIQDATALLAPAKTFETTDRRAWLKTALGVGYAASCLPLSAQTAVRTSSEGLVCGEVMVNVNGFQMPVYRSMPMGKTQCPVVLVVSEIFGVHEYIADITRRLAHQGYMALAPELMLRQGDPSSYAEMGKLIAEVVSKVPDEQVMGDLDACVAWARTQGGDASQLGITGFCWGGRITWLYAAHNPSVKAGVAWYGRLTGPVSRLTWFHNSKRPCWVCTVVQTQAFPWMRSRTCKPHCAAEMRKPSAARFMCMRTHRMHSMPITAQVTAKQKPKTVGNACCAGSKQ